jgi:hypothetical protein
MFLSAFVIKKKYMLYYLQAIIIFVWLILCVMPYVQTCKYTSCTVRYAFCTVRYAFCTVRYASCTVRYAFCTVRYASCTARYGSCTVRFVPCTVRFVSCTVRFVKTIARYANEVGVACTLSFRINCTIRYFWSLNSLIHGVFTNYVSIYLYISIAGSIIVQQCKDIFWYTNEFSTF